MAPVPEPVPVQLPTATKTDCEPGTQVPWETVMESVDDEHELVE